MKWFKFYGQDWLTDLKVMSMSIEDRLCFITLLCLASSEDNGGTVKNCDEESLIRLTHLYEDPHETDNEVSRARGCLERYKALHCVTINDNGDVTVVNFSTRQGENLSNAERQKNYRERHKKAKNKGKIESYKSNNSNADQRNDSNARIDKNRIDKNNTSATRKKKSSEFTPIGADVLKAFEEIDGKNKTYYQNTTQRAACDFLVGEYGLEKVLQAIKILPQINQQKLYIKQITTPYELKENWVKIGNAVRQNQQEKKDKYKVAF